MTVSLFEPLTMRGVTARNRLALSPMCQYSAVDGMFSDYHFSHLGRFALGGFGIVIVEATAVNPIGRVGYGDLGLWKDEQIAPMKRIVDFLKEHGSVPAIQIGHAGRKAATQRPWEGNLPIGPHNAQGQEVGWRRVGASPIAVGEGWPEPSELDVPTLGRLKDDWVAAAKRADAAGFEMLEVHAAHGYLLHTFLSGLSNQRQDKYGGDLSSRMKYPLEVIQAVREVWPDDKPLSVRISAVDGMEGGLTIEDSIAFSKQLRKLAVDFVDCSSGGIGGGATAVRIPRGYGFQVPYAEAIRREAEIKTIAVGLIIEPKLANSVIESGQADIVAIGREALVNPNWPLYAREVLMGKAEYEQWPPQAGWWLERREASLASSRTAAGAGAKS